MKKLTATALFILVLIALSLPLSAAETGTLTLTAPGAELHPGDEFTLTVEMSGNPGIWSVAFDLSLDESAFEFVSWDTDGCIPLSTMFPGFYNESTHTVRYNCFHSDYFKNTEANGKLLIVTYRVTEDAAPGTYDAAFNLDAKNTINVDSELVDFDTVSASLTVTAREGGDSTDTNGGTDTSGGADTSGNGTDPSGGSSGSASSGTETNIPAADVTGTQPSDDTVETVTPGGETDSPVSALPDAITAYPDDTSIPGGTDVQGGGDTFGYIAVWVTFAVLVLVFGAAAVIIVTRRGR